MRYDYIIIGAGTAGCVIANRLSLDEKNKVLLIEAGPHSNLVEVSMPVGYPKLQKSKRDWQYHTAPQTNLNDRVLYQPRGKMIGGTGSMNGMIYIRGQKDDYDNWATTCGNAWSYEELLPFFKRSEDNVQHLNKYHAQGGLLPVSNPLEIHPLNDCFIEAAQNCGLPFNSDFNGTEQRGVGFFQANIKDGRRQSTATTFLEQAKKRSNLKILTNTEVANIILEGDKATGVKIQGSKKVYSCESEIILCSGAINSPKLLMLSGIGDSSQLSSAKIKTWVDLPGVGKNLQDHLQYFISYKSKGIQTLNTSLTIRNLSNYFFSKKGIMAQGISQTGGFFNSDQAQANPNMQFHFVPGIAGDDIHNLKKQPKFDGFMLGVTLLNPKSRGAVHLNQSDPKLKPVINANFLDEQSDMIQLEKSFNLADQILQNNAFSSYSKSRFKPTKTPKTQKEVQNYIRQKTESVYHTAGTCKMGSDQNAVVTADLRVRGIKNLRVADASVMPVITSGNINATVIMIAEKCAEMILNPRK